MQSGAEDADFDPLFSPLERTPKLEKRLGDEDDIMISSSDMGTS